MQKYFVRHKLSVGDITHLSDSDSELILSQNKLHVEDVIEVETYQNTYLAHITDMEKNSVEVEILEDRGARENSYVPSVSIIQALSNDTKFNYFVEKSVEIGIEKIIPTETRYSLRGKSKAIKDYGMWNKIIRDATDQSRNTFPTMIEKPIRIKELLEYNFEEDAVKICLATENVDAKYLCWLPCLSSLSFCGYPYDWSKMSKVCSKRRRCCKGFLPLQFNSESP